MLNANSHHCPAKPANAPTITSKKYRCIIVIEYVPKVGGTAFYENDICHPYAKTRLAGSRSGSTP
jgi:hypothetical protein